MIRTLAAIVVAMSLAATHGQAQPAPAKVDTPAAAKDQPKIAVPGDDDDDKDLALEYNKFIKGLKRIDGAVPVYQKGKNVYLELPIDKIGKTLLLQAAFNTGLDTFMLHAGMPLGGTAVQAFRVERKDDVISLIRPNIASRWNSDDAFRIGAERSFPEAVLGTLRVEAQNPAKKLLLVNATSLFSGDVFRLNEMVMSMLGGPYQLDPNRSGPDAVKGFDDSLVVQMKLHYVSPRGGETNPMLALLGVTGNTLEDDRSAPVRVSYNLSWRKESNYRPRLADPRVGYFTEDYFSVAKFLQSDKTERYIRRWNLEKKDPKAAVSDPVKPIVFTVDPSIPAKYRPAVKEGVARWNKAFLAAGFSNAIIAKDAPEKDSNYDHADGRYNVIRMMVGPSSPFAAISLLRTDPFTAEILNASITLDGNLIEQLMGEHSKLVSTASVKAKQKAQDVFLRREDKQESDDQYLFSTPIEEGAKTLFKRMERYGWEHSACEYASEKAEEASLSWDAIIAAPGGAGVSRDQYVMEYIADCVSHEVGHCLGLRHNFAGSLNLSTAQLADDKLTSQQGVSASVMDYTPPNVQAVLKGHGNFYMTTVGPYDSWAIQYGYQPIDAKTTIGEKFALTQIARQSGLPGHAYLTDEDADEDFNPRAVRFDCSSDPLNFSEKQLVALNRAREWAIKNLPRAGESYSTRTEVVLGTVQRAFREGRIAARFLGGTLGTRNFKGDAKEKPTLQPVSPETQRQALRLITQNFLAAKAFDLPKEILETLSLEEGSEWNAPLRDRIGTLQSSMLALVMGAQTTDRIAENAYKTTGKNAYTLEEHYGAIAGSIFSEIGKGVSIPPLRRDLQRFALDGLVRQASATQGAVNADVRLITGDTLKRLDSRIVAELDHPTGLDTLTKLHLRDLHEQIVLFKSRKLGQTR